jgi:hypothetical protein
LTGTSPSQGHPSRSVPVLDIVFIGIGVVFFVVCVAYTLACEKL